MFKCKYCDFESDRQVVYASHIRKFHKEKQIYIKFDFVKVCEIKSLSIIDLKELILKNIIINNRISPSISSYDFIIKNNLLEMMSNIKYYTLFLPESENIKTRTFCILNNITEYPKCSCGKDIKKFNKKFNSYCSQSCANRFTNYLKDPLFYKELSKKIVKTRRANNSYIPTDNFKNYLKDKNNYNKFKESCFKKYGVYNPGVLGAYSSKSAELYIRNYIKENNIREDRCYFKNGGINNKEYFLNVYDGLTKKYIYLSYDLVVIDDYKNIIEVLEYNGPWHYKEFDVNINPESLATPYPMSKTKKETYNFDILKLNTIFVKCKNIKIYWEKEKKIEKYDGIKI